MTIEPRLPNPGKTFGESRELFEKLVSWLELDDTFSLTLSEVEVAIKADGMDILRRLFQDHIDLHSLREVKQPSIVGADEIERTHRRVSVRSLESIFGGVTVPRLAYTFPGAAALHPLDAELNLPPGLFSFGVCRLVAKETASRPFEKVLESLHEMCAAHIAKRQVENLAVASSIDFEGFYADPARSVSAGHESILVISADGKGVVTRLEDLREGTRKAAERDGQEKGSYRKRMSTVAAVYSIDPFVRRPEDIVDEWRRKIKETKRPRPQGKRVWASIRMEPEDVIRQAFEEAMRRDPGQRMTWVALVDGDLKQIAILEKLAKEFGVRIVIVLDIMHALGYLWRAGNALFGQGSQEAKDWVTERFHRILRGEASLVAAGMRRSATNRGLSADDRKAIDECARYLRNHQKYMRYFEYLSTGMPIATGVIEGACRYLVKDRMELSGTRWSLKGAEAVLKLRALVVSGDFDEYWRFHEAQEAQRNHRALFAIPGLQANEPSQAIAS